MNQTPRDLDNSSRFCCCCVVIYKNIYTEDRLRCVGSKLMLCKANIFDLFRWSLCAEREDIALKISNPIQNCLKLQFKNAAAVRNIEPI